MPRHFKSMTAFKKSLAYIHIHHVPHHHHAVVYIAGKKHKVKISRM